MKNALAWGVALIALYNGAAAQEAPPASDGFYIRLGGGVALPSDWRQDLAYNPDAVFAVAPPTAQTIQLGEGLVAQGALGFDYADGIRTELEYRYAQAAIDGLVQTGGAAPFDMTAIRDDIEAQFIFSNFYFDWNNASPVTPFIGGGVGGAFVENEFGIRDAALAYQGRVGLSLFIGNDFSLDTEYVYVGTNKLVFGPDVDEFVLGGPDGPNISGARYEASNVMVSVRKKF